MPGGGRRPGAGAPKGNLNALRSGRASTRFQVVLAAMLSSPELRDVLFRLRTVDDEARDEIRQIVVASARLLFDYPVNQEVRDLAERAANDYIARLPPGRARIVVERYKQQLGFEDLLPPPRRPRRTSLDDPAFLDFASKLLGINLRSADPGPSINPADLLNAEIECETPDLAGAVERAITQSNAGGACHSRYASRRDRPNSRESDAMASFDVPPAARNSAIAASRLPLSTEDGEGARG